MGHAGNEERSIRDVIEAWAEATRLDRRDEILKNHSSNVVLYDVLPPMKYESAEAYRASWDEWHPDAQGEMTFRVEDLNVTAGNQVGFAYSFIRCGGTLPDGSRFDDLVRATFCLQKIDGSWRIVHQHVSKPVEST